MSQRKINTREELLENTVAILLKRLGGHVILSMEEIEDAGDIEIRSLFETDEVEIRSALKDKNLNQWVTDHESWN